MIFSESFISNDFFQRTMLNADLWADSFPDNIGVTYHTNGDVTILLAVPGVKSVEAEISTSSTRKKRICMEACGNDLFQGVLPFDETFTGPANVQIYYDGVSVIERFLPIIWTANQPYNLIEIPDPEGEYLLVHDIPHGTLVREYMLSNVMGKFERLFVYLPSGYMAEQKDYPVLYLLNGGTDNETSWENVGRVSAILDNLFASNDAVPFIVVMLNSMLRQDGHVRMARDTFLEKLLLDDIIPYVETAYRIKTGKWNRAIGGLSMGAYLTCDIALANPEIFGYVGTFTASMSQTEEQEKNDYLINGMVRPYRDFLNNTSRNHFENLFRVYFRSTTPQEDHPELFYADDRLMAQAGLDQAKCYTRILYPERISKWNSWRMGLRDYAKRIFKEG